MNAIRSSIPPVNQIPATIDGRLSTPNQGVQNQTVQTAEQLQLTKGQIIQAIVQRMSGSTAWLTMGRLSLVAKAETALPLQQPVTLQVTQTGAQGVTLRLLDPQQAATANAGQTLADATASNLVNLLTNWGFDTDETNLTIAKALLTHSQTVTPEDIQAVRTQWNTITNQQPAMLEPLTYLHSNRLPVNAESLALAQHWLEQAQPIAQRLTDLQQLLGDSQIQLQNLGSNNSAANRLQEALGSALRQLAEWSISANLPSTEIAARLPGLITGLNSSPEAVLATQVTVVNTTASNGATTENNVATALAQSLDDGANPLPTTNTNSNTAQPQAAPAQAEAKATDPSQNPLYRLTATVAEALLDPNLDEPTQQVLRRVADQLDVVLKDLGTFQLANLGNSPNLATEPHYLFPIPLQTPEGPSTAKLKLYHKSGQKNIDPNHVRLALLLDLPSLGEMVISLSVHEKVIQGQVLSALAETENAVEADLGQLIERLGSLGYQVNAFTSDILPPPDERDLKTKTATDGSIISRTKVNVHV